MARLQSIIHVLEDLAVLKKDYNLTLTLNDYINVSDIVKKVFLCEQIIFIRRIQLMRLLFEFCNELVLII